MTMYSTILILMIAISALGYCLRHTQASNQRLKDYAEEMNVQLDGLMDGRCKDAELIKQLTWERDAAHFMLETVINDLPEDHQVTMVRRPWVKGTSKHKAEGGDIPGQRTPSESDHKSYFKEQV